MGKQTAVAKDEEEIAKLSEAINESLQNDREAETPAVHLDAEDVGRERVKFTLKIENYSVTFTPGEIDPNVESLAFWGDILGRARRAAINAEAEYRNLRARSYVVLFERSPKISEWKAKAVFEASTMYLEAQAKMAECARNVAILEALLDALKKYDPDTEPPL